MNETVKVDIDHLPLIFKALKDELERLSVEFPNISIFDGIDIVAPLHKWDGETTYEVIIYEKDPGSHLVNEPKRHMIDKFFITVQTNGVAFIDEF